MEDSNSSGRPLYTIEDMEMLALFQGRVKSRIVISRTIRAEADNLRFVDILFRNATDPNAKIQLEAYARCMIEDFQQTHDGTVKAKLRLPRALNRGDRHSYIYHISVDTDVPSRPWVTTVEGTSVKFERARLCVQFDPEELPVRAWALEGTTYFTLSGGATSETGLEIDELGYVEVQFDKLQSGLHYSLAWHWADVTPS